MDRRRLLRDLDDAAVAAAGAIEAVRAAGIVARRKADASPVTDADEAAERMIVAALAAAAPGVPVVAEERCALAGVPARGRRYFLVDPLDGTREFVDGYPHYTVNIALVEDGRATMGVVAAPALGRIWGGDVGVSGRGDAWTRDLPDGARRPVAARAAAVPPVGLASRCVDEAMTRDWFRRAGVERVERVGSSLKLCLLAEGAADFYPRHSATSEWDIAAGQAVLEAAGGQVIVADGSPLRYGRDGCRNPYFVAGGPGRLPPP